MNDPFHTEELREAETEARALYDEASGSAADFDSSALATAIAGCALLMDAAAQLGVDPDALLAQVQEAVERGDLRVLTSTDNSHLN